MEHFNQEPLYLDFEAGAEWGRLTGKVVLEE